MGVNTLFCLYNVDLAQAHIKNIKSHETDKSTVAAHAWEQGHKIDEVKSLKHIKNSSQSVVCKIIIYIEHKSVYHAF